MNTDNLNFIWGFFKVITLVGIIAILAAGTVMPLLVGWAACIVLVWFANGMADPDRHGRIRTYDEVADQITDGVIQKRKRQRRRERKRRQA